MNTAKMRMLAGIVLILTPVAFNVFFTMLSMSFEYPDILREPAGEVLQKFDDGGSGLIATWYAFMLTAVLFVPLAILVHKVLVRDDTPYLAIATAFGVVAGIVQFLGLVRWPLLVPFLADTYLDPASSTATKDSALVTFEAFNQYAGVAVGENLGYLFTALWTLLVSAAMFGSDLPFRKWLGALGLVSAAAIFIGILEPAGFELAADIVVFGYILWSVWLALFGSFILFTSRVQDQIRETQPASRPAADVLSVGGTPS